MRASKFTMLPLLLVFCLHGLAQNSDQEKYEALKSIINNKDFRFLPQSATTTKGNTLPVDPGFELKIMTDSLIVDLPFFGTGYDTNFGSNDEVKINTKEYTYSAETTKKGGWSITIVPKDKSKFERIYMNITSAGYCTMQLKISSQQHISYYGAMGDNLPH